MTFARIAATCRAAGLDVFAAFHPAPGDGAPKGCRTLLLLGPHEPGFWARLTASPEFSAPDPVDRWSARVVSALATDLGARALFPFGGPPYPPFVAWALASGAVWQSPVSLLVHSRAGLFLSFRGALAFSRQIDLPPPPASPCASCAGKPCLSACPAGVLGVEGYDVGGCHSFLDTAGGQACMEAGCQVRRACPKSRDYGRLAAQSAHHMRHFHRTPPS